MRTLPAAEFRREVAGRARGFLAPAGVSEAVAAILLAVREQGDAALVEFTARFDGVTLEPAALEVPAAEVAGAAARVGDEVLAALRLARARIEAFHRRQVPAGYRLEEPSGNVLGVMVRPLGRVGVYVPGGRASYPSSVLMGAVPARLAGVAEVIVCTPPGPDGRVDPAVLAAAAEAGVSRVFRVGGAQAIAALAWGTPGTSTSPRPSGRCSERWTSTGSTVRARWASSPTSGLTRSGWPPT